MLCGSCVPVIGCDEGAVCCSMLPWWSAVQGRSTPEAIIWASTSVVHHSSLQTDGKRETMTEDNIRSYRRVQSDVLLQWAMQHNRFQVLDVQNITSMAPSSSSADGIHYMEAVYDASANVFLNMVLRHMQLVDGIKPACLNCPL